MSTPEQRFEVPPEYAEVYERAYRRAYDVGPDDLAPSASRASSGRGVDNPSSAARRRGKRIAVPAQRGSGAGGHRRLPETATAAPAAPAAPRPRDRPAPARRRDTTSSARRHRAARRPGSTALPALGLALLLAALVVGAFLLGRFTAPREAARSGDAAPESTSATGGGADAGSTTYPGPKRVVAVRSVSSGCAALPRSASGSGSTSADNVLDDDPTTAWQCGGVAVGEVLRLVLPAGSRVVQVGILPGFVGVDPATGAADGVERHRVSRVRWDLGDGVAVTQEISTDPADRSLRTLSVPPTTAGTVRLTILGVERGERDVTAISTVRVWVSR